MTVQAGGATCGAGLTLGHPAAPLVSPAVRALIEIVEVITGSVADDSVMGGERLWLRRYFWARWPSTSALATLACFDRVQLDALLAGRQQHDGFPLRWLENPKIPMAALLAAAHVELLPGTTAGLEVAPVSGIRLDFTGAVWATVPKSTEGPAGRAE